MEQITVKKRKFLIFRSGRKHSMILCIGEKAEVFILELKVTVREARESNVPPVLYNSITLPLATIVM